MASDLKTMAELKGSSKSDLIAYAADFGIVLDTALTAAGMVKDFLAKGGTVASDKLKVVDKRPRKLITIHAGGGSAGDAPVFLSCNGFAIRVQRGVKVAVLPEFIEILDHAVQTVFTEGPDHRLIGRQVRAYDYTLHGDA